MLKVVKFGGSSMADAGQYQKVRDIVLSDPSRKIVVVSAAGKRFSGDHKLTDLLYLCHAHLKYGVSVDNIFSMVRERYMEIRDQLKIKVDLESDFDALLSKMKNGISEDELVSRGEYFSAKLMAAYLGFEFIDAAEWLHFKLDGSVDKEFSYETLKKLVGENKAVIPGFYGVMPDGHIKCMSRGGSDITGAFAAAALDADVYENWTDVSGILMADPRIVKDARSISHITYSELRELSYIGAQVLHEDTIFPVREKNIALNIRNTNDPQNPGTIIKDHFENEDPAAGNIITGIAGKKGFVTIVVTKNGMSSEVGALRKLLSIFEKYEVCVSYFLNGIDCSSLVIDSKALEPKRYAILADIQSELQPDHIHVSDDMAMLAVVGRKMVFRSGSSGKIFQALGESGINVRLISQGPEELNIIIGVREKDFNGAVLALYNKFVK